MCSKKLQVIVHRNIRNLILNYSEAAFWEVYMKKDSIRFKMVASTLLVTFFVLCFCGVLSSIFFFRIIKNQVLQDEEQKLNQMAAQLFNIQDEMEKLAKSIAADPEIQRYVSRENGGDVFRFFTGKQEIEKIFSKYLNIRSSSYSVTMVTNYGTYYSSYAQNENDITEIQWYKNWKEQGRTKGFTSVHMYEDNSGAISYVMGFYDMLSGSKRLGDIIIHINYEEIVKNLQGSGEILKSLQLTDGFGNQLWLQGEVGPIDAGSMIDQDGSLVDNWKLTAEISNWKVLYKLRYIFIFFVLLFLPALVLLGVILFSIMSKVLHPIDLLVEGTREVGKGNFNCSVQVDTKDEFRVLSETFNVMVADIGQYISNMIEYEKTAKNMEINRLMLQINPHFIYNTLNSIVYMAQIGGNENIVIFSKAFISLLHDTLNVEKDDIFITLEQEISNVANYLVLQSYRYAGKFQVIWDIDKTCLDALVPNVLIQPLVENAVYHGICGKPGTGILKISSQFTEKNTLLISVEDDGVGMSEEKAEQLLKGDFKIEGAMRKIGIANIRERIRYIYGSAYGMQIKSKEAAGTRITMEIPYKTDEDKKGKV